MGALFLIYIPKTMADEGLKKAFLNFANQGKSGATVQELDNKNWTKMAKDCGLYNKTCTSTDGDITFRNFAATRASTSLLTFSSSSSTSWLPNFTKVTPMQFRSTVNSSLTKVRRTTKERRWRPEITSAK